MGRRANRLRYSGARHWAAPFVLAMLCLRALVPAGFMLAPVEGRLEVVLCDSDAPSATHRHGSHDHAGHHQHAKADPTCPYAQSAGPAPLPALPVVAAPPLEAALGVSAGDTQVHAHFGPIRQQSPRGPPQLT